uniref:Uncharacterized protein n=1 Tax=Arundo donax TaxID=35708 RepID=A0A0A9GSJ2_ARUDO
MGGEAAGGGADAVATGGEGDGAGGDVVAIAAEVEDTMHLAERAVYQDMLQVLLPPFFNH